MDDIINNIKKLNINQTINQTINKGTGAGGKNTNHYGISFENKTSNEKRLLESGFKKEKGYLIKKYPDYEVIFVTQSELKNYIKNEYSIKLFRNPDEAYIIKRNNEKTIIKVIEKKEQRVEGSVETKLWSGPSLKREYSIILGDQFEVEYSFCVNSFLENKMKSNELKYQVLQQILDENQIPILYGDSDDYFENLDNWLNL